MSHRCQRSSTLAPVLFTQRYLVTGPIFPQTSTSLWRPSCSPRLPASPPAPRWCSPACAWPSPLWRSTQCPRPGQVQWQRWCGCFRRRAGGWMDGHAASRCWNCSPCYLRSSRPAVCHSTERDRYGCTDLLLPLQVPMADCTDLGYSLVGMTANSWSIKGVIDWLNLTCWVLNILVATFRLKMFSVKHATFLNARFYLTGIRINLVRLFVLWTCCSPPPRFGVPWAGSGAQCAPCCSNCCGERTAPGQWKLACCAACRRGFCWMCPSVKAKGWCTTALVPCLTRSSLTPPWRP